MTGPRYEVIVVRHGTMTSRRSHVYLNYHQYGEPDAPFDLDYHFWVVRNASHTVLVDTGFARRPAEARGRTVLHDPVEVCRRLGVEDDPSLTLVVTHAHYDHIGNLAAFPRATVLVCAAEMDFWASPVATRPLIGHFCEPGEIDELARADEQGRVQRFEATAEAAPGVTVTRVGGHTPGQSMVTVPTSEGVVLLASDVAHFTEEWQRDMPFVFATDLPAMYNGLEEVRRRLAGGEVATVVTGHDAGLVDRLPPYREDLRGVAGVIGRLPS